MPSASADLDERISRLSRALVGDPCFDDAVASFCIATSRWFRDDARRIGVLEDLGQMAVVAAGFAWQGESGVTLARLIKFATKSEIASARRVRSICHNLGRLGVVTLSPERSGWREKPLRFNDWLEPALRSWLDLFAEAIAPWRPGNAVFSGRPLSVLLALQLEAFDRHGTGLLSDWPELRFFLERAAGYPILMELMAARPGAPGPSRKRLAEAYGVSRRHIASLMANGEKQAWIEADPLGRSLALTQATRERLRAWIARLFAIMILALEPGDQAEP